MASATWSIARRRILDAGPREDRRPSPTMLSMSTSPIRRYVLLRHGGQETSASRWSMERIAPAPGGAGRLPSDDQPTKSADERA